MYWYDIECASNVCYTALFVRSACFWSACNNAIV